LKAVHKKPSDWTAADIAAFWDWQSKNLLRQQQYFTATMAPGIVKFIKTKGLLKGEVLDYGCGAGHLLKEMLRKSSADFYGVDFSEDSINETKRQTENSPNLKGLVVIEGLPTPFKNEQFDFITLIETIEHLQDEALDQTMQELFRILKPGGKIFVTTPFNEDLNQHLNFCPFCKSEFHEMQHMQSFDVAALQALAARHGFSTDGCVNMDIERLKLGPVKYLIKRMLVKLVIAAGLKEAPLTTTPNLIVFFVKP